VGLAPGEAAVALLLRPPASGPAPPPLAVTKAIVFEEADEPFQNVERRQGRAVVAALGRALQISSLSLDGDLYVNLNGEEWRAAELGAGLIALPAGAVGGYRVIAPATSVGDVGAAAGALHVACALRSFARGYAAGPHAWVLTTSDYGDASVLCVGAA
jgi:3-oxoacyl-[acyl-carrier-protein] synthase-1